MLAEIFLRQREEKGRLKGRAEVVEELSEGYEGVKTLEEAKELLRQARETIRQASEMMDEDTSQLRVSLDWLGYPPEWSFAH